VPPSEQSAVGRPTPVITPDLARTTFDRVKDLQTRVRDDCGSSFQTSAALTHSFHMPADTLSSQNQVFHIQKDPSFKNLVLKLSRTETYHPIIPEAGSFAQKPPCTICNLRKPETRPNPRQNHTRTPRQIRLFRSFRIASQHGEASYKVQVRCIGCRLAWTPWRCINAYTARIELMPVEIMEGSDQNRSCFSRQVRLNRLTRQSSPDMQNL
jgi:hypothetical protein